MRKNLPVATGGERRHRGTQAAPAVSDVGACNRRRTDKAPEARIRDADVGSHCAAEAAVEGLGSLCRIHVGLGRCFRPSQCCTAFPGCCAAFHVCCAALLCRIPIYARANFASNNLCL